MVDHAQLKSAQAGPAIAVTPSEFADLVRRVERIVHTPIAQSWLRGPRFR